ncbi:substrate-binding domain-containing protein [uncultured Oscillibacter sp.]|uniref:substrate-binding domain-containing protein n=1 Tax=uncultured Oscillibacter sp. TaxID=876091 RepID=UPI0026225F13|nr:substrate-binding domain-containing protein [uncultured Oscillibacter sp.]
MKTEKSRLIQIAILAALGLAAALSLALPQLLRGEREPQLLSLTVLLRDTDSSGWTVARQGMEQAADELGAELRFLTLAAANDGAEQEELLLREIEDGAAALVVVPADPAALSAALDPWLVVCPVVTLESPMEGAAGVVSPDNALLGQELAEALLEDWDGGEVLLLDTAGRCAGVSARLEAAEETLSAEGIPARRAEALPEEPPRWVMAFEPSVTQRTAEGREAGGRDFALYGVGSAAAITAQLERGNLAAIAAWSDYAAGYLAVRRAVNAVRGTGGALGPLPFFILREEDIYAPENQKLLFPIMSSSSR